jgi:hypothetical protein
MEFYEAPPADEWFHVSFAFLTYEQQNIKQVRLA